MSDSRAEGTCTRRATREDATGLQTHPRQPSTVAVFVGELQERPSSQLRNSPCATSTQLRNSQSLQGQAFAQFDNDVAPRERAAACGRHWSSYARTFLAPLGYVNAARSTGRSPVPDPERALLVRRAFQEFATGRFTKDEVRKNLGGLGLKTRRGQPVSSQTFDALLRNRVYIWSDRCAGFWDFEATPAAPGWD